MMMMMMMMKPAPLLLLLAGLGAGGSAAAAAPDTRATFARPQQMIDVGGRRMHLHCSGSGPVTVVFDAYSGGTGWSWYQVQPEVAKRTRACVYDRAGLGFSDPSSRPGTSANAVDDLQTLLGAAGIAPPYVLVGSSYGGANAQLFAYRHPAQVAGLVLVEPHHEDETARGNAASGGKLKQMYAMQAQMTAACIEHAEKGFVPGSEAMASCVGATIPEQGRELAAAHMAHAMSAPRRRAMAAEEAQFDTSGGQLRAARRTFGDLPLVVLVRTLNPFADPSKPPSKLVKAMEAENLKIQKEVAALSRRGEVRIIAGAGHIIHETKPEAVVKAVLDVVGQVQN
ncbi:MAG: alpha/beta hydrolase [Pseudomonadota bacterium]